MAGLRGGWATAVIPKHRLRPAAVRRRRPVFVHSFGFVRGFGFVRIRSISFCFVRIRSDSFGFVRTRSPRPTPRTSPNANETGRKRYDGPAGGLAMTTVEAVYQDGVFNPLG